jgi:8-oxo-dGTP pyrophosphatase MutT (NUDIX family)
VSGGTGDRGGGADAPGPAPRVDVRRVRFRREVGPEHVGRRVSLRSLVDDGDGPRPTDRVGRLLAWDDDAVLVVDRTGFIHVLDPATVVASRLVPPHPRVPPEPEGGTRDRPIPREGARVLLLDDRDRVLLIAHLPGDGRRVWTAPGGGLDAGEDHATAAARELREEVGLDVPLGPWVWERTASFAFRGVWIAQHERWFLVRLGPGGAPDADALPIADPGTAGGRWWSITDLGTAAAPDVLAPAALPEALAALLRDGPPAAPVDVGP